MTTWFQSDCIWINNKQEIQELDKAIDEELENESDRIVLKLGLLDIYDYDEIARRANVPRETVALIFLSSVHRLERQLGTNLSLLRHIYKENSLAHLRKEYRDFRFQRILLELQFDDVDTHQGLPIHVLDSWWNIVQARRIEEQGLEAEIFDFARKVEKTRNQQSHWTSVLVRDEELVAVP